VDSEVKQGVFYGWHDKQAAVFRLSRLPPDCPIRSSVAFETALAAEQAAVTKRSRILWWPPLEVGDLPYGPEVTESYPA
jgi:hypothetical protein